MAVDVHGIVFAEGALTMLSGTIVNVKTIQRDRSSLFTIRSIKEPVFKSPS